MPAKCPYCEGDSHNDKEEKDNCERRFITAEEALSVISNEYHVFISNGMVILGTDWDKESITDLLLKAKFIEICDPEGYARRMKHGICVPADIENWQSYKFIKTDEEKLKKLEIECERFYQQQKESNNGKT